MPGKELSYNYNLIYSCTLLNAPSAQNLVLHNAWLGAALRLQVDQSLLLPYTVGAPSAHKVVLGGRD